MSDREDSLEASIFVNRVEEDVEMSNQNSESRDMSPTGIAAREPFGDSGPLVNEVRERAKAKEAALSVDDVMRNIVLHEDKPIENLPVIVAPELKLIGRCVSLSVRKSAHLEDQRCYYTGLVCSVTRTTVTLMHVHRYTRTDYSKFIAREKQVNKDGRRAEETSSTATKDSGLLSYGYTAAGEVDVGKDGALVCTPDPSALLRLDAAGSLAPATPLRTAEDIAAQESASSPNQHGAVDTAETSTPALRYKGVCSGDGSVGPLPYVSFLRQNVHGIRFGRDPRSSFYSLFQDPEKEIMDMQYLRVFVRRYLVHTSVDNNTCQAPLYAFVTVRSASPNMDRELVDRVAREELRGLMKVDRSIEREKKRQRSRAIRQGRTMGEYQAPNDISPRGGAPFATHVPQATFITIIVILVLVLVFSVYLGVSMGVLRDPLIVSYERKLLRYFIPSILVWALAGSVSLVQSCYARVPQRISVASMSLHSVCSIGAVACAVMVIVVVVVHLTDGKLFEFMNAASAYELCKFYDLHNCSGFWDTCSSNSNPMCGSGCAHVAGQHDSATCYANIRNCVQLQLVPLLVFAVLFLCLFAYSMLMWWWLRCTASHRHAREN